MPVHSFSIPEETAKELKDMQFKLGGMSSAIRVGTKLLRGILKSQRAVDLLAPALQKKPNPVLDVELTSELAFTMLADLSENQDNWKYVLEQCKANNITPGKFLDSMLTWARRKADERA